MKIGTIGEGVTLSNTKAQTLDECTLACITRNSASASCVGYNFNQDTSPKCQLLNQITYERDTRFASSVLGLCLTMGTEESEIIHTDAEGHREGDDDDDDDDSDSAIIAIILTAIVLIIIFSLMAYCAYVYGKNKRMQEESKSAPHDDFPISAHQLTSADVIAEQRLFEQAVAANNAANSQNYKRSVEHSGAIQVMQDPETGSSQHKNSLDYLAAQPPITSNSSTLSKPPPSNPIPVRTKEGPPPAYIDDDDNLHGVSSDVKETKGGSIYEEEEESP